MRTTLVLLASLLLAPAARAALEITPPVPTHARTLCPAGNGEIQEEPAAAIRDSVVVVSFNDSRGACPALGYQVAGWAWSLDGGASFVEGGVLPGGSRWSADQWLMFDPDGALYHTALSAESSGRHGVLLSRGTVSAAGIAWNTPLAYVPTVGSCDKPAMAIDPASGAIHVAYTLFAGPTNPASGLWMLRSTDQGASFAAPVQVTSIAPSAGAQAAIPLVLLDGSLGLLWKVGSVQDSLVTIRFARSTDGGVTFGAAQTLGASCVFNVPGSDGSPVFPQIAEDRSTGPTRGNLYVAWQTACAREGIRTPGDVSVIRSTDSGATWGPAVVANSDSGTTAHTQPTMVADRDGRLWLFSLRAVAAGDSSLVDLVLARSLDGGASFEPLRTITDTAAVWGQAGVAGALSHGEYITAVETADGIGVAYPDSRRGDPDVYWVMVRETGVTGVPAPAAPRAAKIEGVEPNPSGTRMQVRFSLVRASGVTIAIHDAAGRRIRRLLVEERPAGSSRVTWDLAADNGRPVPAGTYFVRLRAGESTDARPVTVVR